MDLFNVYPRFDITPVKGNGCYLYDSKGTQYLDLYGGHGVISIGHGHPHYLKRLQEQLSRLGFYSNSVNIPVQEKLANLLGEQSGYTEHQLFLCNSGAEANENALKLASFHTNKRMVIAFKNSFHGRTAAALNVTDNCISAPINQSNFYVQMLELNDFAAAEKALASNEAAAVIVEGIQGVGGLDMPSAEFLQFLSLNCRQNGALLILDEIQSGYGRTGAFFAHQHADIEADIVTVAKGMGNGFPMAGVLIHQQVQASLGMLGTTFGGNHLACAAGCAVLETIEEEHLLLNAHIVGQWLKNALENIPEVIKVKGMGLMLGIETDKAVKPERLSLLHEYNILTGASSNPKVLRILPPLNISIDHLKPFIAALSTVLTNS